MSQKKVQKKPHKPPMVHKPLIRSGEQLAPQREVQPSKRQQRLAAERAAAAEATAPGKKPSAATAAQAQEARALQERIDRQLLNSADPEISTDLIFKDFELRHVIVDDNMQKAITEGRLQAHANRIARHYTSLVQADPRINISYLENQIAQSVDILTYYKAMDRAYQVLNVATREEYDWEIDQILSDVKKIAAERIEKAERAVAVGLAQSHWRTLSSARFYDDNPDMCRDALIKTLDTLGDYQHEAFPRNVRTREEVNQKIEEAYIAAKKAEEEAALARQRDQARWLFRNLGNNNDFFDYRRINPDTELEKLRQAITDNLGGDTALLLEEWEPKPPAEAIEKEIQRRHRSAMHRFADELMRERKIRRPLTSPYDNTIPERVKIIAEAGFVPPPALLAQLTHSAGLSSQAPKEPTEVEKTMSQNEAIRFAMVTDYFVRRNQPFVEMLRQTTQAMEAVGGPDKLDHLTGRFGLTTEEWDTIKAFLAHSAPLIAVKEEPVAVEPEPEQAAEPPAPEKTVSEPATPETVIISAFEETAVEVGTEVQAEPDIAIVPEPEIAARPFDLSDPDITPIVTALAEDPAALDRLLDQISEPDIWDVGYSNRITGIYRAHIQHLLVMDEPQEAMAAFAAHLDMAASLFASPRPPVSAKARAYAEIIHDCLDRLDAKPAPRTNGPAIEGGGPSFDELAPR